MAFLERIRNENLKENGGISTGKNDNVGFGLLGKSKKHTALCDVGNTVYHSRDTKSAKKQVKKPFEKTPILKPVQKAPKIIICDEAATKTDTLMSLDSWDDCGDDCTGCESGKDIDVYIAPTLTAADIEKLALAPFSRKRKVSLNDSVGLPDFPTSEDEYFDDNIWKLPTPELSPFVIGTFEFDVPPVYDFD